MNVDLDNAWASLAFRIPREMWQHAHNADLTDDPDVGHVALMRLLGTISDYAAIRDQWLNEHIIAPLLLAAHAALNLPHGNVDAGRVSEWLDALAEALGLEH